MPDARIDQLTEATVVQSADLFVLSQSGQAKKLTGTTLLRDLAAELDAHGGIANISYTPPSWVPSPPSQALAGDLVITLADDSSELIKLYNGRGIANITDTTSGTSGNGQYHDLTFTYNDGTTSTLRLRDGVKGDQGIQTTVYIKWSEDYPQSSGDLLDSPADNTPWIGIFVSPWGVSVPYAPTDPEEYLWYNYKGAKGDTGASIDDITGPVSSGLEDTYTINMTDGNTHDFVVTNGNGIESITRSGAVPASGTTDAGMNVTYTIRFTNGDTTTFTVYNGIDGQGSVSTVSGIPASNGDVPQVVTGSGAPTTATQGIEKQIYLDTQNDGMLYYCLGLNNGSYIWRGASVTVDSSMDTTSTRPLQNAVISQKIGTGSLNTTATNLVGAINEVKAAIPSASNATPLVDTTNGAVGNGTAWARSNHQHPLNVPTSGVPAQLGTPSLGSASTYARSDHVHKKPTSAEIGAVPLTELLDLTYPIGSYYWSSDGTDPAYLFGGEWESVNDVFMLAAGSTYTIGDGVAQDGGEINHTLAENELPAITKTFRTRGIGGSGNTLISNVGGYTVSKVTTLAKQKTVATSESTDYVEDVSFSIGSGASHNNMPPYVVAYCWHRYA